MDQPPLEIIFEDRHLLVINKPAGLLSIRDGFDASLPYARQVLESLYGRLWTVHRLDRDTSGLLLLARSPESHRALNSIFEHHQAHKTYHAIIIGVPPWREQHVDLPLKVDGDRHHRTIVSLDKGKPARTDLTFLRSSGEHTLIEARPFTGYTHQIRAHLYALGFPVLADPLYYINQSQSSGFGSPNPPIRRLALHAFSISFSHPITTASITLVAPYPADFQNALKELSLE
jgi:RluA family pseudouridine synthase